VGVGSDYCVSLSVGFAIAPSRAKWFTRKETGRWNGGWDIAKLPHVLVHRPSMRILSAAVVTGTGCARGSYRAKKCDSAGEFAFDRTDFDLKRGEGIVAGPSNDYRGWSAPLLWSLLGFDTGGGTCISRARQAKRWDQQIVTIRRAVVYGDRDDPEGKRQGISGGKRNFRRTIRVTLPVTYPGASFTRKRKGITGFS